MKNLEELMELLDVIVKSSPQGNRNEMLKYLVLKEAKRISEFDNDVKKALEHYKERISR